MPTRQTRCGRRFMNEGFDLAFAKTFIRSADFDLANRCLVGKEDGGRRGREARFFMGGFSEKRLPMAFALHSHSGLDLAH